MQMTDRAGDFLGLASTAMAKEPRAKSAKWPGWARVSFALGMAGLSWCAVIGAASLVIGA